jgi:hypothetical protein
MKNLHLIQTDRPSRLHLWTDESGTRLELCDLEYSHTRNTQHIYITSDEEIKRGDYFLSLNEDESYLEVTLNDKVDDFNEYADEDWTENCKKIILTTDQDLIKDGVQSIDDTFLEWFINNPRCEWVDINRDWGYPKIIIPQEEPKDVVLGYKTSIVPQMLDSKEVKEEPKIGENSFENFANVTSMANFMFGVKEQTHIEKELDYMIDLGESKQQETLEEAAENWNRSFDEYDEFVPKHNINIQNSFTAGAKWQAQRMYSDAIEFGKWLDDNTQQREYYPMSAMTIEELFEEFKKK